MIGSRIVVPALRSALAPWTLTSAAAIRQPTVLSNVAPLRFANVRESLEASFERIRLMEETPIAMELLNRNARRPKKVSPLQRLHDRTCVCTPITASARARTTADDRSVSVAARHRLTS
ncbi:hypothetical protein FI667_g6138, partial [Globisporangium splendens]